MSNLLPPEAKKHMHTEYVMRVIILALYSVSFIALGAAVLTVPSVYLVKSQQVGIAEEYQMSQQAGVSFTEAEATIKNVNTFVEDVTTMYAYDRLIPFAEAVLALRTEAISLSNVRVIRDEAYQPISMTVSGEAANRIALPVFVAELETLPMVAAVDLPIENLAKETDVPFTVHVTLTNAQDI